MSRYIDREALLEKQETIELPDPYGGEYQIDIIHTYYVKNAPTADVVEVRHGKWEDRHENKYANHLYECSLCGEIAPEGTKYNELGNPERIQVFSPYCPNCGAKMDGERREE